MVITRAAPLSLRGFVPAAYSALLAASVLGPLFRPGHLLLRDAVSTPRSYLTDTALGLGDAAPRAVPQDALLACLSAFVDGGLVVKAIMFLALWLAGLGAASLARELLSASVGPQLVAATVACWNPYVAERLLQGHWSLLTGYAALPWIALLGHRLRAPHSSGLGDWGALAVCFVAAGLTPTGGVMAVIVAVVVLDGRRRLVAVGLGIVAWLPWLVATVVSGAGAEMSDPEGVLAFAARAEPGLGTIGSLAGLGGIWNAQAVPPSRTGLFAVVATIALLVLVAIGLPALLRRGLAPLVLLAAAAIVLPALAATPPGLAVGRWLVASVPGGGLVRDTQKFVALAVPCYALAAAATSAGIIAAIGRRWSARLAAAPVVVLVLATLPDLAFGVGGKIRPVEYPASWQRVAAALGESDVTGDVAVLPAGTFRKFAYAGVAPVLDPAPRLLPRDVVQTGTLVVRGHRIGGEGERALGVERVLMHGGSAQQLARFGVGAVLVERTTPGPLGASDRTLAQLHRVYADTELALYAVPGSIARQPDRLRRAAISAHLLWASLLLGGAVVAVGSRVRARSDKT